MSMWLTTRTKVFEELSDKQQFMCICGRLPSSLHERSCTKFNNKVTSETVKRLKHLIPKTGRYYVCLATAPKRNLKMKNHEREE